MKRLFGSAEWVCYSLGCAMLFLSLILVPQNAALGQVQPVQHCPATFPGANPGQCNSDCQIYQDSDGNYYCGNYCGQKDLGTCLSANNCNLCKCTACVYVPQQGPVEYYCYCI